MKSLKRKSPAEAIMYMFVSIIFMAVALSYVYILVYALLSGFKTNTEIVMNPFHLPTVWHWENYIDVFSQLEVNGNTFVNMFINSVYFSISTSLISQFVCMTFAYCCTKYKFPGSELIYTIILVVITLPIYGSGGATYRLYRGLGLIDSYAYVITAASGINMGFLYYRAFFKNMSWTYAEATMMDGGNAFDIYYRVMMPQAKPIFGALFLSGWMSSWNDYGAALIYFPNLPTLPVGIYQFNIEMVYRARMDILFAACVLVCIPSLTLFIMFNKAITTNISVGGIKG